ncbi:hypothetical protein ADUPG1_007250, partial [Aduncisulcus paluster]
VETELEEQEREEFFRLKKVKDKKQRDDALAGQMELLQEELKRTKALADEIDKVEVQVGMKKAESVEEEEEEEEEEVKGKGPLKGTEKSLMNCLKELSVPEPIVVLELCHYRATTKINGLRVKGVFEGKPVSNINEKFKATFQDEMVKYQKQQIEKLQKQAKYKREEEEKLDGEDLIRVEDEEEDMIIPKVDDDLDHVLSSTIGGSALDSVSKKMHSSVKREKEFNRRIEEMKKNGTYSEKAKEKLIEEFGIKKEEGDEFLREEDVVAFGDDPEQGQSADDEFYVTADDYLAATAKYGVSPRFIVVIFRSIREFESFLRNNGNPNKIIPPKIHAQIKDLIPKVKARKGHVRLMPNGRFVPWHPNVEGELKIVQDKKDVKSLRKWMIIIFIVVVLVLIFGANAGVEHLETHIPHREPALDLYGVLHIDSSASEKDIKSSYRKLARKYHPDRNPDCPDCEEMMGELAFAQTVLLDKDRRRYFDMYGTDMPKYMQLKKSMDRQGVRPVKAVKIDEEWKE